MIVKGVIYISFLSWIVPFLIFIYLRNTKIRVINLVFFLVTSSGILDFISFFLALRRIPNAIFGNTYFILQCAFAIIIYYHLYLKDHKSFRPLAFGFGVLFILVNTFFWQGIYTVQNLNWMLTAGIIIVMSFGHFSHMNRNPVIDIQKYAPYWISTGFLFYCSLSFAIFGISRFLLENLKTGDEFRFVWMFHNINNIFKNGCFAAAIWWASKREVSLDNVKENEIETDV